eukprot:276681_1
MASSGIKLGREDYKKKKELEEFRKLGAAPAEVDDDGYSINPHIPQYMAEAPWYLSNGRPGLRHQRLTKDTSKIAKVGHIVKKGYKLDEDGHVIRNKRWTKGACENCGASSHKTKECVYRPRKLKAKYVPTNLAPEEHIQSVEDDKVYTYDGKRDRWNNYNIANHQLIIERHHKIAQYRRAKKAAELDKQILDRNADKKKIKKLKQKAKKIKTTKKKRKDNTETHDGDDSSEVLSSDSDSDDSDDSDLDSDDDMKDRGEVIQRFDSKKRQTVRNLRIREDLPKYLRNLSTKSAYYDPKTRSMRANPYRQTDISDEMYMGDNFIRQTGDAVKFEDVNTFVWQSRAINGQKSEGIHLQSNPTMTELAFKEFNSKKYSVEDKFKANLMKRYGEQQSAPLDEDTRELIYGQSEMYREYGADGRVIKGQEELIASSKYEEDVFPGNHVSIWGSWYDLQNGKWGYACCHCTTFHAFCTGNEGIKARTNSTNANKSVTNRNMNESGVIGVVPKPKEMEDADKLVNPSGYISTRGIMAAKGIARKMQKEQMEKDKISKIKKRAKRKKKKLQKRMRLNQISSDGEPSPKRVKLNSDDD